ncbi:alpha/beta fold hydrolase [Cognaticolwellia aestuarii]|uniref:alpha/beta fold hydrolase n=1 Tax=Cognaticolwellia aestuarii TaxID=329993 RepID=UPI0009851CEA|nr:alpha/beta hydrolase [Cognaticolwellia aestuarii]
MEKTPKINRQNIAIDTRFIATPYGEIYIKQWIPENAYDKPALILVHDSLGSVELWKDFPAILSERLSRRVIAYDRLGFGRSFARNELPSVNFIEEEALIYFPLIKEALSISHYLLLGHSVGGAMAITIAANDPDCLGAITISAQAFVEELTLSGISNAKAFFAQPVQMKRLEKYHGKKTQWVLSAWIDVWLSPEFSNWNLAGCITKVKCPVLAIHGANDEYGSVAFPCYIKNNVSGIAQTEIITDCGHIPHKEKQSEVVDAIEQFFTAHAL